MVPILGELLDDPYSAVRCMAERSLRQFAGALPAAYDYTTEPPLREPIAPAVLKAWSQGAVTRTNLPSQVLVRNDAEWTAKALAKEKSRRDDRPLRLRE